MPVTNAILIAALALAAAGASGQTVYRCGSSYSTQPCAGGAALDVSDPTTPQTARQAADAAKADRKRADAMEKARLEQDKNAPKAVVLGPVPASAAPASAKPHEKKKAKGKKAQDPEVFTAVAPGKTGKK
jgi:hypothetical protein